MGVAPCFLSSSSPQPRAEKESFMLNKSLTKAPAGTVSAGQSLLLQLAAAAGLGLIVLYGVAFAESPVAHNAAHDVRHVTVKPCH
jgi:cobalt transporter subunit CbtB